MSFALSTDDFASGRFTKVARFIMRKWPGENTLSLSQAKELLSQYLGHTTLHDAQQSAFVSPVTNSEFSPKTFDVTIALVSTGISYPDAITFVKSWPVGSLGKCSSSALKCVPVTKEIAEDLRAILRMKWKHPTVFRGQARPVRKNIFDILTPEIDISGDGIEDKTIGSFFTEQMALELAGSLLWEAIFEYVNQSGSKQRKMELDCGEVKEKLIKMPWSEQGWPGITAIATDFIKEEILPFSAFDLYIKPHQLPDYFAQGRFWFANRENIKTTIHDYGSKSLVFSVAREIEDDCTEFKISNWCSFLRDESKNCVASISGTLFVPDATQPYCGFYLFDAADMVSDSAAKIANTFLRTYAYSFCDDDDERVVNVNDVDITPLTMQGNIVFLYEWERSRLSAPGVGAECLRLTMEILKKKYKRNINLVSTVAATQYIETKCTPLIVERMRYADSNKILKYLERAIPTKVVQQSWLMLTRPDPEIAVDEIIAAHHSDFLNRGASAEELQERCDKFMEAIKKFT